MVCFTIAYCIVLLYVITPVIPRIHLTCPVVGEFGDGGPTEVVVQVLPHQHDHQGPGRGGSVHVTVDLPADQPRRRQLLSILTGTGPLDTCIQLTSFKRAYMYYVVLKTGP